jgi:hypothetical protein
VIYTLSITFFSSRVFWGSTQVLCFGDPPGRIHGGSFGGVSETNGVSITYYSLLRVHRRETDGSTTHWFILTPLFMFPINDNDYNDYNTRLHHPDTKANASDAERTRAEERSKLITNAYQMIKASLKR